MHKRNILAAGTPVDQAEKAMIFIHGRGADARGILDIASALNVSGFALLAPQATGNTWYPYSFLSPVQMNEPWLSSAIATVHGLIDEVIEAGIKAENIYLLGFSQGACLTLESAARKAQRYGGLIAFTGGLIGDKIDRSNYNGDFAGTPVFIGTGDPDPHIPVSRVKESNLVLTEMGAAVTEKIYPGIPHTVIQDEIDWVNINILQ
ncbi:MAG TPA: dienelactone hydrolase family protein [Chitinophagaceae bacterium]|nr:dienelactone hydrolase family protein [Chitinophagaceae bacterium]